MRKSSPHDPAALRVEAAGLRWLAEASAGRGPGGGARVVEVVGEGDGWLDTETVRGTAARPAGARAFGRALARTHAAGAPSFGCAPPGWTGDGRIGAAVLPLREAAGAGPGTWGAFYAQDRLLPFLRAARDAGAIDAAGARVVDRVAARTAAGRFDHPQPALVPDAVARVHGDLWSGNVLWDASAGGEGVLIDPAAHGGHAETDLAMLALFGQAHLGELLAGYQEVSPPAAGWRDRVGLHQLHPLLVHAVLFGPAYGGRAVAVASRYA